MKPTKDQDNDVSVNDVLPRRGFLKASTATPFGLAMFHAEAHAQEANVEPKRLPLTVAGYPYERVTAIQDGRVKIDRCKVDFETSKIGELNQHVFSGAQSRDVTEVGLIPYLLAFCNDGFRDYLPLPIFVLKVFRHKSIFVHTDRGISNPEDLRGRKVATVGYSSSGLTWVRGILKDEYGVSPEEIKWVITEKDSAAGQTGGASKWEKLLPPKISVEKAPAGKDESDLLLEGTVDAIFHPAEPRAYVERHPKVQRLFRDSREVEQRYFKKTGIYPIMHLVVIRRELAEQHQWLPKAVFDAYCKSKQLDLSESKRIRWAYSSLPWYGQEFNETVKLMGPNFYSYGIPQNRKALETVFRYLNDQGLAKRRLSVEKLFLESTLELEDA
ncbi:4,5-dihydroxyphthalate decarboxylase [Symmachiella macrocystis]|uniref:4,5-dihydroxyphthalate decarboxylase n=1 Tax=Symmachiella macrocystis TaxID=2527985 RepID=A0A5C6BRT4_9PLAN|nr:ABC transporter substrate-binding protein [Symmachiella macrocystis]TWU13394.1 4,5-dihydroxyphthalate decarboxylase [Symmachiella macrocystis]